LGAVALLRELCLLNTFAGYLYIINGLDGLHIGGALDLSYFSSSFVKVKIRFPEKKGK